MSADLSKLIPVSLQPIGGQEANAVSARALYSQLGLADSQWSRWFPKNILNNEFAEEHKDWEGLDIMSSANSANPKSRPQETKDFFLAVPFAKKLAMKAHTPEGERVRDYFLACEQVAITPRATPVFHIPQTRAEALRYAADLEDQCVTLSCTVQAQAEDIKVLEPMAAAGHAITQDHARAQLPPRMCVIALPRGAADWGIALSLLPANAQRTEFSLWTLYSWPPTPAAAPAPAAAPRG